MAAGLRIGRELGCRDDPDNGPGHDSGRVLDRSSRYDDATEPASVWVGTDAGRIGRIAVER